MLSNSFLLRLFLILIPVVSFGQENSFSAQVSTFTIEAPQLQSVKKIWLYLPKGYAQTKKKYPVIYMHDAQNLFDKKSDYSGEWQVDKTLDSIHAQVIVVGIEHGNEKRLDELTPYPNLKYGGGKADAYLQFIVETLKPHIDSVYRTKMEAKNTVIFGSSLGGLVSYYAVLKYPKVFGRAGVFSPSFWFTNDIYTLTETTPMINAKMYFLCGDNEDVTTVADMEKIIALVNQKPHRKKQLSEKVIVKGGQHNEKLWRENFLNAYLWLID